MTTEGKENLMDVQAARDGVRAILDEGRVRHLRDFLAQAVHDRRVDTEVVEATCELTLDLMDCVDTLSRVTH